MFKYILKFFNKENKRKELRWEIGWKKPQERNEHFSRLFKKLYGVKNNE